MKALLEAALAGASGAAGRIALMLVTRRMNRRTLHEIAGMLRAASEALDQLQAQLPKKD